MSDDEINVSLIRDFAYNIEEIKEWPKTLESVSINLL